MNAQDGIRFSIVVPLYNEAASLASLYVRLTQVMSTLEGRYEIIFVDDGSRDRTPQLLEEICESDSRVKVVTLHRNFGQTAALKAGFDAARGDVVISMDGDLQHTVVSCIRRQANEPGGKAWLEGLDRMAISRRKARITTCDTASTFRGRRRGLTRASRSARSLVPAR